MGAVGVSGFPTIQQTDGIRDVAVNRSGDGKAVVCLEGGCRYIAWANHMVLTSLCVEGHVHDEPRGTRIRLLERSIKQSGLSKGVSLGTDQHIHSVSLYIVKPTPY